MNLNRRQPAASQKSPSELRIYLENPSLSYTTLPGTPCAFPSITITHESICLAVPFLPECDLLKFFGSWFSRALLLQIFDVGLISISNNYLRLTSQCFIGRYLPILQTIIVFLLISSKTDRQLLQISELASKIRLINYKTRSNSFQLKCER